MLFYSSTPNPLGFGHPFLLKPNQQGTALSALQGGGGSTSEDRTTSQDAAAQIVAMLQNDATTRGDADWPNSWGKKGDGKGYSELAKADSKPSHLHGNVAVARHGKKKTFCFERVRNVGFMEHVFGHTASRPVDANWVSV